MAIQSKTSRGTIDRSHTSLTDDRKQAVAQLSISCFDSCIMAVSDDEILAGHIIIVILSKTIS